MASSRNLHCLRGGSMNAFSAISDATRRAMLDLLVKKPMTAGEIGKHFSSITQPGISKHLSVLREAKLVSVTVSAQNRVYTLDMKGFKELEDWVSKYREFWNRSLDSLEKYLEKNSPKNRKVDRK